MSKADIDELRIIIEGEDAEATSTIDKVISALERLEKVAGQIKGTNFFKGSEDSGDKTAAQTEKMEESLSRVEGKYRSVADKADGLAQSTSQAAKEAEKLQANLDNVRTVSDSGRASAMEDMAKEADKASQSMNELADKASNAGAKGTKSLSDMVPPLKRIGKEILKIQTFPFKGISSQLNGITSRIKGIGKSLLRIAKLRLYRGIIKAFVAGLREGIGNAYQWAKVFDNQFAASMDRVAASTQYLKNSLGAMVMPIWNALAPAFDMLIDKVVAVLNVINQLIARLTGASTWTRAVKVPKAYADSMANAADSAAKLNEELITILGIDELNIMEDAKDNAGGGGGGAADAVDYSSMFVEEKLGDMSDRMAKFFDPFVKAWEQKGQRVVNSFNTAMDNIKSLCAAVGDSFWTVWTNGTGQKSIEHLLDILANIMDVFGNLAASFRKGWVTGNVGTDIIQGLWDVLNDVLDMFNRITAATAEWAKELDFYPLLDSIRSVVDALKPLVDMVTNGLAWAWENVLLPLGKWAIEEEVPAILHTLADEADLIYQVVKPLQPILKAIWDEFISPLAGYIGDKLVSHLDKIRELIQKISDLLHTEINGKSFLDTVYELLGETITRLKYIKDFISDLLSGDWDKLAADFEGIINPTGSEFYIDLIGKVTGIKDNVPTKEKRLDDIQGGVSTISDSIPKKNRHINGLTALFTDKGVSKNISPVFWLWNGFTALFGKKEGSFDFNWSGFTAWFKEKKNKFNLNWEGFTAWFKEKKNSFSLTWDGFTALFKRHEKGSSWVDTIQGMVANFQTGTLGVGWNPVISNMIASFTESVKAKGWSDTISGLVASFKERTLGANVTSPVGVTANMGNRTVADAVKKAIDVTANMKSRTLADKVKEKIDITANMAKRSVASAVSKAIDLTANFTKRSIADKVKAAVDITANLNKRKVNFDTTVTMTAKLTSGSNSGGYKILPAAKGGIFERGKYRPIPQYADGTLNAGSVFMAGEAGPELVGHVSGRTEVLNQSQLAATMAASMSEANASQNSLLREQNSLIRELISAQGYTRAVITAGDVVDGLQQMNRRDGRTVVPIGV